MPACLFVSDLHGRPARYEALFAAIQDREPAALFMGGDLFPMVFAALDANLGLPEDFARDYLAARFQALRSRMKDRYPSVFLILGNDDPRADEPAIVEGEARGLWFYCHEHRHRLGDFTVYGYCYVPPTPFLFKDWERYDVSRYVPPGGVSPEEGNRSVAADARVIRYATIRGDLDRLAADETLDRAIFLFHTPPYETHLDRVAADGKAVDLVPLDLHVGSIAVRRFIESRQPLVTLHGHIHESARLTGSWRDRLGRTHAFSAAHDGPELALVTFDPENPAQATRELV